MKIFLGWLSCFLLSTLPSSAQRNNDPVKVTDLLRIRQINSVSFSPDGKKILFVSNSIEPDGDTKWEYKYINQLYLVPADASAPPRALTTKDNASQPAWSPDGKQVAFVRTADNKPQIFLLSLDGGEAVQLTRFRYGASAPRWSPDGKRLLFAASISVKDLVRDPELNPRREIPQWPTEKPAF